MQEAPASVEGNEALRRCVRDLVALSTLPAIWGNARRPQIAESLSEILTRALALDLAFVRVCSAHEPDVDAVHDRSGLLGEAAARAAAAAIGPWLTPAGVDQLRVVPHPAGEGSLRLVVLPLGHQNDVGLLAAGAARADFPNETDRLLLSVAANQAAIVLQRRQTEEQLQRSESDLAASLRALTEADRRKDEFLAILAHELRNPLAPLRNAVAILNAKGSDVPEVQWARAVIDRQVEQMSRLVDDLLDVSRISRGQIELRKERVALATIVSTALEASRPTIEKGGHELTVVLPAEPLVVEGDVVRLGQVLLNLLDNACKYTDHGGRISLVVEHDGAQAVIRVRDSGIGIPREMLVDIFDMFTQVDRSLERAKGGLGIGLTLVSRLAAMHGGSVEAHSEGPGRGSELVVRLPLVEVPRSGVAEGRQEAARPRAHPRRILVVDDNRDSADSLAMLLGLQGHEVQTCYDGLAAIEAVRSFRPDVALLDIGLPGLNGYEAARRIRETEEGKEIALVAITGWGQEEDRRRSASAGFDHHVTKPVELKELDRLLAALPR